MTHGMVDDNNAMPRAHGAPCYTPAMRVVGMKGREPV